MKKILLILPAIALFIGSCGNQEVANDALDTKMEDKDDFDDAIVSFADGEATTGEQYFFGVQAEVVEIDVKLREMEDLDAMDAPVSDFNASMDEMIEMINGTRKALDLYKTKDWPKRQELHDLTIEWVAGVETLVNDYLRDLAEPLSGPDDNWSDSNLELYEKYIEAEETFYADIDDRWVQFQDVFAAANGFELSDEAIDMEALIEDDLEE